MRLIISTVVTVPLMLSTLLAETWHLEHGKQWKTVSVNNNYLLAVARAKKLVNTGQCKAAEKALTQIKNNFPKIVAPDPNSRKAFDALIKAEILFCKGKFTRAVRSYDKFLNKYYHTSEFYEVALDRQFSIATAFLSGRKVTVLGIFKIKGYATGVKIMEGIINRVGLDSQIGLKAAKAIAESYERRGKFVEAYFQWQEISLQWQTTRVGRDALLSMAQCKHAAYRGPKYDASDLNGRPSNADSYYESAEGCYKKFKSLFPKDAEKIGVDKILNQINEQLAYKQFCIGRYYQKTGSTRVAKFYYRMVINNWPKSTAAKMADEMIKEENTPENLRGEKVKK